eukprot:3690168-Pyramimonas_sp.AAC.1
MAKKPLFHSKSGGLNVELCIGARCNCLVSRPRVNAADAVYRMLTFFSGSSMLKMNGFTRFLEASTWDSAL